MCLWQQIDATKPGNFYFIVQIKPQFVDVTPQVI
jgi:hypothetical protein